MEKIEIFLILAISIPFGIWAMRSAWNDEREKKLMYEEKLKNDEIYRKKNEEFYKRIIELNQQDIERRKKNEDSYIYEDEEEDEEDEDYDDDEEDYYNDDDDESYIEEENIDYSRFKSIDGEKSKKENWIEFKEVLIRNNITKFYHFTDASNISSIKKFGLYSWQYCENNNINIELPGSSEQSRQLDSRDGLQNYVRISFVKNNPMMYYALNIGRINKPVLLEIDIEVALFKHTKFSNMNATKNGAEVGDSLKYLKNIRFDLLKNNKHFDIENENERHFFQAEILVLESIPSRYILNINSI